MIKFMGQNLINELKKNQNRHFKDVQVKIERSNEEDGNQEKENVVLEFSFSSETPYLRYYGYEIISHEKSAMNFERLKAKAPLLFNHDWDQQLGVIERAWIGDDRRGYVRVKLSRSDFAKDKIKDIEDGILSSVSFGYIIDEIILSKKSEEEPNEYTVTKCTPYEVSLVTVPADFSVGIGRSMNSDEKIQVRGIEPEVQQPIQVTVNEPAVKSAPTHGGDKMDPVEQERNRITEIQAWGEKFGKQDLAKSLVQNGTSVEEAGKVFMKELDFKQKPASDNDGNIGLSEREQNSYSFLRAMNALANPNDKRAQEAAAFEKECSAAAVKASGNEAKGIMVPMDILRQKRDMTAGVASQGGNLIATDLQSGSYIEILRQVAALTRAGAQFMTGLKGNISIPRQNGSANSYWVAEGNAPTESALAFGLLNLAPKTLAGHVDITRQLLMQSSIDVENLVRYDLIKTFALAIDKAGLYGTGSANQQPTGLVGQTGLNIVDITGGANAASYADVIEMETLVAADNAEVGFMKYLMNTSTRGALKQKPIVAGYPSFVFNSDNTVNGRPTDVSNQVNAGDMFYGNWFDLIIALWGGLDLIVDPYTEATKGIVRIVGHQSADVGARHGESFARAFDATP